MVEVAWIQHLLGMFLSNFDEKIIQMQWSESRLQPHIVDPIIQRELILWRCINHLGEYRDGGTNKKQGDNDYPEAQNTSLENNTG